ELENARKDTNLKEFQQLQRWATGNIDGNNEDNKVVLQISALHSLRAYLKGEYGESFRRGAYEIFRATLATQHQKILTQVRDNKFETIANAIDNCQLTKQLNVIASEEWFNLLINHNFPTKGISLVKVDLSRTYLHHRTYGKTLDLRKAQLQDVYLRHAQLQEANLQSAQLQGVNLINAQLQGVSLMDAQLQGADLRDAQLQGANLWGAQLQGANLQSTQLQGANLGDTKLQGANLGDTKLQGAYIGTYEWTNFEQRIKRQINKETDSQNLKEQYGALDDEEKSMLIFELKMVDKFAIPRIESASETLDLSKAITGKYSKKEAKKWLNTYKEVVKDDDF
ncbi:pentapeptide repeat-containing protein, partial [Bathymodiolus thermophilus thioautotrophic gill symbiont]